MAENGSDLFRKCEEEMAGVKQRQFAARGHNHDFIAKGEAEARRFGRAGEAGSREPNPGIPSSQGRWERGEIPLKFHIGDLLVGQSALSLFRRSAGLDEL